MRRSILVISVAVVFLALLVSTNSVQASENNSSPVIHRQQQQTLPADFLSFIRPLDAAKLRTERSFAVAAVSCKVCGERSGSCHAACGKGRGTGGCHSKCRSQKSVCKRDCGMDHGSGKKDKITIDLPGQAAPGLSDSRGWQRQQIQAYRNWRHGKLVKFRSQAKDKALITGMLYPPKGEGPFPAIVLMHGRGGAFPYQENWAYLLSRYGYVTLMVDGYCGRGLRCLRLGKTTKTRAWKKMRQTEFRIGDAKAGIAYLASLPVVDKDRIGGFGFSRGGSALMDSVVRPSEFRLKALVAVYPQDMRSITQNVGWSLPTIVSIPTVKHKDRKINYSRENNRASFPRDGFTVEVLSLPNATIKYDQPGEEVMTVIGTRFHRKFNREATLETEKRAIRLFSEHLGGNLEPAE